MASVAPIPSLHPTLDTLDFQESRALYNSLQDDEAQPHVANRHIENLAALFVHHHVHTASGIHLIHGHFQIPDDTVMIGTNFWNPRMRWSKATSFKELDVSSVHGHIFMHTNAGFRAYEFQDGPLLDLSNVDRDFLAEFSHYITANKLVQVIGLQVLENSTDYNHGMSELILDQGTIMLDTSIVKNCQPTRTTGWTFESSDGTPRVCQNNETHSKMTSGNHKVFNAGKPLPKLDNVKDIRAALVEAGLM